MEHGVLLAAGILDVLGSPVAMVIYLIVLMLSISGLTAYTLQALHLLRKNGGKSEAVQESVRFVNLSQIDQELEKKGQTHYDRVELKTLCEDFRDYAAGTLGLYYDISDIRRFVAGMGMSKLMILQGISGTGKTSLAYAAGAYFGNPSVVVPIQPMWKERSDLVGYFNEFTGHFNETTLLCKLYEAGGTQDVYVTVLDEVNISRIEYYFAEFLSLLELPDPKRRMLDIVADSRDNDPKRLQDGKLLLPENMWFIGTANNDDSTFSISEKVYDRSAVIDLDRKCAPFTPKTVPAARISYGDLERCFAEAKQRYALSDAGRKRLVRLDGYLTEQLRISFGNRIMRQIEDYVPIMIGCGGTETGALDDILARKIFRKLERLSPALLRNQIPELKKLLEESFGAGAMPLSSEYLDRLSKTV